MALIQLKVQVGGRRGVLADVDSWCFCWHVHPHVTHAVLFSEVELTR